MTSSYLFYLVYLERRLFPDQYKMTASSKSNNSKATQMYTPNISIKERANEPEFAEVHSNLSDLNLEWKETEKSERAGNEKCTRRSPTGTREVYIFTWGLGSVSSSLQWRWQGLIAPPFEAG